MDRQQGKLDTRGVSFHIPSLPVVDFDTFGEYTVTWKSEFGAMIWTLKPIMIC